MTSASHAKRNSLYEEEIEVKPSTELIPDEYEHFENPEQKFIFHTFASVGIKVDKDNEEKFVETITNVGIEFKSVSRHSLDRDDLFKILDKVRQDCTEKDAGLILYFSGYVKVHDGILDTDRPENNTSIQDIWMMFSSHNCLKLKNKPKVFIFDLKVVEPSIQSDGMMIPKSPMSPYDTPAEADILVICNKISLAEDHPDFTLQFCENIKWHGDKENIITLASCTESFIPPTIISTLTRNFYFTPSNLRGHHLEINKKHEQLKHHVKQIHDVVKSNIPLEKKKKTGLLESFRKNFMKPNETRSDSASSGHTNTDNTDNKSKAIGKPPTPVPQQKRMSGPIGSRSRRLSQSEPQGSRSSARRKSDKKPDWKY